MKKMKKFKITYQTQRSKTVKERICVAESERMAKLAHYVHIAPKSTILKVEEIKD